MFKFLLGVLILASNFFGVSRPSAETNYIEVFPSFDTAGYVTLTPPAGGNFYGFRDYKGTYPDTSVLMCYGDVHQVALTFAGYYTMENCWANGGGNTPDGTYWTAVTFAGSSYTPDWTGDIYYWRATRSGGLWSSNASSPPVAMDQAVSTPADMPVRIDLSAGASGNPTSAAIVSDPTHGELKFISSTLVRYKLTNCHLGTDSFQFTLTNADGTSNVAKATITITAVDAPTLAVHLVDPYLLKNVIINIDETNINLTPNYRTLSQNWPAIEAKGLVADDASAAIAIIQTNDCANDVTLTTTNGTTLLPYSPNFLTTAPVAGTPSLPPIAVGSLERGGRFYYGAALVQAPVGAPAPSFTDKIDVTAQQGTQTAKASMDVVPPPVVLVHGIWGDMTSLGGKDGKGGIDGLAHYLKTTSPWLAHPELVEVLCYSKYFGFNAETDPLSSSGGCEQTSKNAITGTIAMLLKQLDKEKIVGSRVDVVAHSMGGLAARYYSSQLSYRKLRNRQQGKFHKVITLDTPELGSRLARFLLKHSDCKFKTFGFAGILCNPFDLPTVRECFAKARMPLAAPDEPLASGAVFSLYPPNTKSGGYPPGATFKDNAIKKLLNANIQANIPDADWRAISATAPDNGKLENLLNSVISEVKSGNTATCRPITDNNTIDKILVDDPDPPCSDPPKNDTMVTLCSQLGGEADRAHTFKTFPNLSHTGLPETIAFVVPGLNDNVLESPLVWRKVCRWLSSPTNTCPFPDGATLVSDSKASPANKNAVPMPHIVIAHPHFVDRLTLRVPAGLELGTPFELAVNTGIDDLPELKVEQSDEMGTGREVPATIARVEGRMVYLSVTPEFFGNTEFKIVAAYRDGGVASKAFTTTVNLPPKPPAQFHANALPFAGIQLNLNPSTNLQPWAVYANIPGRVNLPARYVSYSIAPGVGPPVVRLDPNGVVHGLRPGTATIIGRFGSLTDQVRVEVAAEQQ